MPKKTLLSAYERLNDTLSGLSFARDVEIPIYLVHNSPHPEDYTFLIDFERFLREAKLGIFARPVLKVWAGRADFDRGTFARNLREAFSHEFARMRAEAAIPKKEGWFSFRFTDVLSGSLAVNFLGTVVLYVAVTGGKMALRKAGSVLGIGRLLSLSKGNDALDNVEADILEKQRVVDSALAMVNVTLHRELYVHAYRGSNPGSMTGIDHDAWPLPEYVKLHLDDGKTGSWW